MRHSLLNIFRSSQHNTAHSAHTERTQIQTDPDKTKDERRSSSSSSSISSRQEHQQETADDAFTTPVDVEDVAGKGACLSIASAAIASAANVASSSAANNPVPKLTPGQDNFARLYATSSKEHNPPQPLEVDGPKPDLNEIHDLIRTHGFGYVIDEKGTEQGKETHLMVLFLYVRGSINATQGMRKILSARLKWKVCSGERQRLEAIMSVQNQDKDPHLDRCPSDWQPQYLSGKESWAPVQHTCPALQMENGSGRERRLLSHFRQRFQAKSGRAVFQ